jgi:hypothetical protein
MLDQHWLGDINDSTDNDLNAAALTNVRLKRFAPTPVEQRSDSGHARCWRRTLGAGDASQDPDAHRGVSTRQWSADRLVFSFGATTYGVGLPPPVGAGIKSAFASGAARMPK